MQTRKRAKSVAFGKAEKKKEEVKPKVAAKEESKSTTVAPNAADADVAEKKIEKAEVVERRAVSEKVPTEKPETPPEIVKTPVTLEEITPVNDVDNQPTQASTDVKSVAPESVVPLSDNLSTPVAESEVNPQPTQVTQELSPTPPPSAFTLQNNNLDTSSSNPAEKGKHFFLYFFVIALFAFVLGLGAMAAITYGFIKVPFSLNQKWLTTKIAAPTATPVPKASSTPAPTTKPVDTSAYTVSVLNGSGIVGKAAEVKSSLETAGFKVSSVGNADRNDYTNTQIAAKKSVDKTYLASLETELKKSFHLDAVSIIPSDASQKTDVVITLGKTAAK